MANNKVMSYLPKNSFIHRLTGTTKLIVFLLFSIASMITFDTRVLLIMLLISLISFKFSKIKFREVKVMFVFMIVFLILNTIFIYLFAPEQGVEIYGSRTVLFEGIGRYTVTAEQLFYVFNVCLKYFTALPMAILFISSTNPSEFAASLNGIGVSYKIGYSVSLALRYIPDVQRDFQEISQAQQARGVELDKSVRLTKRIKNSIAILFPLILSSIERIEVISNAMELRGFGKHKKRTWYKKQAFKKTDYLVIIFAILLLVFSIVVTYHDGTRFYNPFV